MARSVPPGGRPGWLVKSVILLSPVPMALAFSTISPILPKMSAALAHDAAGAYLVKMVLGVVGVAMLLGAPLAGLLADKIERRRLLAAAALVFAAAGTAPFALDSLPLILASRILMGLAATAAYVIGAALVADVFEEVERARWMGIFTAVAVVGGMIALLLAGALGDLGWRWPFLTYLAGAPLAVLAWVGLRGAALPAGRSAPDSQARPAQRAPASFPYTLAFLGLLIGVVIYVPSIYIPFHLAALGVGSPSAIGRTLMFAMITSTAASALFGRARRRLSSRAAFCCSFATVALGVGAVAIAPNYPVVLVGMFLEGAGIGWLSPNLMAAAADAVDESLRGRTLGVVRAAYSLAPALGVTAFEPIAARVGAEGVLLLTCAVAVLMFLGIAATGLRRRPPGLGGLPGAARVPTE